MNGAYDQRATLLFGLTTIGLLVVSGALLLLPGQGLDDSTRLNLVVSAATAIGAPLLGLLIIRRMPRQRIGWLWITYALMVGLRTLGHGLYHRHGGQSAGYSSLTYLALWLTEPANMGFLVCQILLLLWFPNGRLPSRRWRPMYGGIGLAYLLLAQSLFTVGPNWNGGAAAGGIVIDNPLGVIPDHALNLGFFGFLGLVILTLLAMSSLVRRYRAAGTTVRLQIRWYVFGGVLLIAMSFSPLYALDNSTLTAAILNVLSASAIVPVYVAVGLAILRYRLYEIDVIIRKTLQYAVLTGLLALLYFGSVVVLQALLGRLIGEESPLLIVLSTLLIAALFSPLRRRVQAFIDRRFFRRKYDAAQVLARFATTARDEVELERLQTAMLDAVQRSMAPMASSIWLAGKQTPRRSGVLRTP